VAAKPGGRKRRIAFAQRKHVCAAINQELDHFDVSFHARYVQGSVAKVASFVDIDASINQSLGSSEVAPLHNAMECIVAITPGRIQVGKISVGKVRYFVQSRKYLFKLVAHDRHEHSLYTVSWKSAFASILHPRRNLPEKEHHFEFTFRFAFTFSLTFILNALVVGDPNSLPESNPSPIPKTSRACELF
jgi:hypothetical protein